MNVSKMVTCSDIIDVPSHLKSEYWLGETPYVFSGKNTRIKSILTKAGADTTIPRFDGSNYLSESNHTSAVCSGEHKLLNILKIGSTT